MDPKQVFLKSFAKELGTLTRRIRMTAERLSKSSAGGAFNSSRRWGRGMERDLVRPFSLDDDPALLDMNSLDVSIISAPCWAVLNGKLRVAPSRLDADSECVAIIDVSRSILNECFGGEFSQGQSLEKVRSLMTSAAVFLALAETAGFSLRVQIVRGTEIVELYDRVPRRMVESVLTHLVRLLSHGLRQGLERPNSIEPFCLVQSCSSALRMPAGRIVGVFSDFLDPINDVLGPGMGYGTVLSQMMLRHQVMLVDIASPEDDVFPVPRWYDFEAAKLETSTGARHVEQGLQLRRIDKRVAISWNRQRREALARLMWMAKRGHADYLRLYGRWFGAIHTKMRDALRRKR